MVFLFIWRVCFSVTFDFRGASKQYVGTFSSLHWHIVWCCRSKHFSPTSILSLSHITQAIFRCQVLHTFFSSFFYIQFSTASSMWAASSNLLPLCLCVLMSFRVVVRLFQICKAYWSALHSRHVIFYAFISMSFWAYFHWFGTY